MIKSIRFIIAHCRFEGCTKHLYVSSLESLSALGWGISHDKKLCACPAHKDFYNRPGRGKTQKETVQPSFYDWRTLPQGRIVINSPLLSHEQLLTQLGDDSKLMQFLPQLQSDIAAIVLNKYKEQNK